MSVAPVAEVIFDSCVPCQVWIAFGADVVALRHALQRLHAKLEELWPSSGDDKAIGAQRPHIFGSIFVPVRVASRGNIIASFRVLNIPLLHRVEQIMDSQDALPLLERDLSR
eukprot:SAG31_NODE_1567_length_7859_cov_18.238531_5_plen_112_part_00